MKVAHTIGVPLSEFWRMTPWQLYVFIEAHNEKIAEDFETMISSAWHFATFQRAAKLPKLNVILKERKKQSSKKIDDRDILLRMKAYQRKRDEENGKSS